MNLYKKKEKAKEGLRLNGVSEAGCRLECTVIFRSDSFTDGLGLNRDGLGLKTNQSGTYTAHHNPPQIIHHHSITHSIQEYLKCPIWRQMV